MNINKHDTYEEMLSKLVQNETISKSNNLTRVNSK
jgi:hypothetical protein